MPCGALYDITSIHASYIIKIFIIFKMLYNDYWIIMVTARIRRHCEKNYVVIRRSNLVKNAIN
ncbi:hypothetical protein RHORCCE3_0560 [Rickettsia hoogstraalii str. RCCE3]|nr:hypothetical protein RHORCCE3_0560 [Rickettsia hoogstraalii str. RCCE3]